MRKNGMVGISEGISNQVTTEAKAFVEDVNRPI